MTDMKCDMKSNLLFYNIREFPDEDCNGLIQNLQLKLKLNDVDIESAHRLGRRRDQVDKNMTFPKSTSLEVDKSARPIVARFASRSDREKVKREGSGLREHGLNLSEQYPREVVQKRKELMPILKREKQKDYLRYVTIPKYRVALTKLRCSSHTLGVETGRYKKLIRSSRICSNCTGNEVDDEYHFTLICPKHASLRELYIPRYYYEFPTIIKFVTLMSSNSTDLLWNLSKFVFHAMK
ncbi:hypothetical protein LOTGIDRAFT_157275 [Lottia gigantea]|uniref:Uncharacterized protein n=1 Tax=Lottia gigantea TaxID=225164 RepID=V4CIW0_LOTGI|nr:hypothetical protein LOTGIDRAFT_157275 [Lottia gigantea]ESP02125.1 hypothetical protein LOTGIDRAFT_157275 [Lottia gigantea]